MTLGALSACVSSPKMRVDSVMGEHSSPQWHLWTDTQSDESFTKGTDCRSRRLCACMTIQVSLSVHAGMTNLRCLQPNPNFMILSRVKRSSCLMRLFCFQGGKGRADWRSQNTKPNHLYHYPHISLLIWLFWENQTSYRRDKQVYYYVNDWTRKWHFQVVGVRLISLLH